MTNCKEKSFYHCYRCPTQCRAGRIVVLEHDLEHVEMSEATRLIALDALQTFREEEAAEQ